LREAPPDFTRHATDDVIRVGVVVDRPAENVDTYSSFFEIVLMAFESAFDNMLEEAAIPFAVPENRAYEDPFQLLAHFAVEYVGG
jgi:hypothetical protein